MSGYYRIVDCQIVVCKMRMTEDKKSAEVPCVAATGWDENQFRWRVLLPFPHGYTADATGLHARPRSKGTDVIAKTLYNFIPQGVTNLYAPTSSIGDSLRNAIVKLVNPVNVITDKECNRGM